MPKQRITKESVVDAAFDIARRYGMEQVMVKNIADNIGCSVQPIYSYCNSMEDLKRDVVERVDAFISEYVAARIDKDDMFRSTGKAYIQLAQDEPNLFKIFILHKREGISSLKDLYRSEANPQIAEYISKDLNISTEKAIELHLNILIYTIGIGAIFSVTSPGISASEIYTHQELAYKAFLEQALKNDD